MPRGCSLLLHLHSMPVVKLDRAVAIPATNKRPRTTNSIAAAANGITELHRSKPIAATQSTMVRSTSLIELGRRLRVRPSPELGLLSLLFVLSTAVGAIISLAIISIPIMSAFRRLSGSMKKLVHLVSEEVPGTLSSLKLSGLEINDLIQQLGSLRQKISGNQCAKSDRKG